ncbi:MAG TPA: hypothetical protein VH500_09090 [Nitrososphaeraceae archaeon]|jgi:hypothetical protein
MKKRIFVYLSVAILVFTAISSGLYQQHQSFNAKAVQINDQTCGAAHCNAITQSGTNRSNSLSGFDIK